MRACISYFSALLSSRTPLLRAAENGEMVPALRRAGRRTNVALLIMVLAAFGSGWVAFASGRPTSASITTAVHGLFGVAVVVLLPWKSMIIRRAAALRVASVALLVLIVGCLLAGFVQLFAGYLVVAGVSPMQVHVGAAVLSLPFLAWHLFRSRPQRLRRVDLSRRVLLRASTLSLGVGVGYALLAAVAAWSSPGRPRASTGSRSLEASAIPATTWLFDTVPDLDPSTHRVDVAGRRLSAGELAGGGVVRARLDCTSGWYVDAEWTGTRLADLVAPELLAAGRSLVVRSVTGYTRSFPIEDADSLWLAVSCGGQLLRPGTGAPVRLVAPGRRGFWWVKWVASVEVSSEPSWQQPPFPLQ
jgi:Oxidoreductase molybdopterin binding domain